MRSTRNKNMTYLSYDIAYTNSIMMKYNGLAGKSIIAVVLCVSFLESYGMALIQNTLYF